MEKTPNFYSAKNLYEAMQQLGWNADSDSIAERVKRLDVGLPAEDEFIYIISWLNKCSLVHKLDQNQIPPSSQNIYQVPDLFTSFDTLVGSKNVFIEIKTTNDKKIVWSKSYLDKLKNYSLLTNTPLLLAWKYSGLWLLVDINVFEKAKTAFHLSFETAMKHNLMSYLAGDFAYFMKPNVGLHFVMKKMELISKKTLTKKSFSEQWRGKIVEAYFTDAKGVKNTKLPDGLWPLFISTNPEPQDRIEKDFIYQSFVITENSGMAFAYKVLSTLTSLSTEENNKIHWRKKLIDHRFPIDFKYLNDAVYKGLEMGYIRYVFELQPVIIPSFLKDLSEELGRLRKLKQKPES